MIRIAIVEDEDREASALQGFLERYEAESGENFEVTRYSNVVTFLDPYRGYDLVFLDIVMPMMNGMDGAGKLREMDKAVQIIFVTTMSQYALRGYEVDALDFIVKPVTYQGLVFDLKRALQSIARMKSMEITLPGPSGVLRVLSSDITYVEVRGHKLTCHLLHGRPIEVRGSLKNAQEALEGAGFLLCNSCYLVNPRHIGRVKDYSVFVAGDELSISHPKRKAFLEQLTAWYAEGGM